MTAVLRIALLAAGWVFLALGAVGAVLPVVPTTPFLLLAAACFLRSSERLHRRLVSHPVLGAHIGDYLAGRGLCARAKAAAVGTLWGSILLTGGLFATSAPLRLLLAATGAAVTAYLLRLPTAEPEGR